jgi:hypothetical protein
MRELRVLGAVVLATSGWLALVLIGCWLEPRESFLIAWFLFVPLGPVLSAVIVTAPQFRGTEMKAPAMAAAIVPCGAVARCGGHQSTTGPHPRPLSRLVPRGRGEILGVGYVRAGAPKAIRPQHPCGALVAAAADTH